MMKKCKIDLTGTGNTHKSTLDLFNAKSGVQDFQQLNSVFSIFFLRLRWKRSEAFSAAHRFSSKASFKMIAEGAIQQCRSCPEFRFGHVFHLHVSCPIMLRVESMSTIAQCRRGCPRCWHCLPPCRRNAPKADRYP